MPAVPPKTTAVTVQPDSTPYPVSGTEVAGVGSFVGAAIALILYLRRRVPKDSLEVLKDRTEGKMLVQSWAERDKAIAEAREAWTQLNSMQRDFGRLTAENEYLRRELGDARALITEIRQGVQQVGRRVDATENNLKAVERRVGPSSPAPLEKE